MSPEQIDPPQAAEGSAFSVADIRRALDGPRALRRPLAKWLLPIVDREVRITLRPFALRHRRDLRDVADDLVQDVLVLLFHDDGRVLRAWEPARGMQLPGFVALVTRRAIYRRFKGFRGNPWSNDPLDAKDLTARLDDGITERPTILAEVEYRMQLDAILSMLRAELGDRDWRLFTKLYVEQRRPAEVGDEEGMKENAVHKWRSRFQQRVQQMFEVRPASAGGPRHAPSSPALEDRS